MELDALKGAKNIIQKKRPTLYMENAGDVPGHDLTEKSPELIRYLFESGYKVYWHFPTVYNPNIYFGNDDNVFRFPVEEWWISSSNMLAIPKDHRTVVGGLQEAKIDDEPVGALERWNASNKAKAAK